MPIGLVLSGGASLGAIQVGMLHALYEQGIAPDLIVATSVGAVNGAFIASRPPTVATAEALGDAGLHREEVIDRIAIDAGAATRSVDWSAAKPATSSREAASRVNWTTRP